MSDKIQIQSFCIAIFHMPDWQNMITRDLDKFQYICGGQELCPTTGRKHMQVYAELHSRTWLSTLYKRYPKCNFWKRNIKNEKVALLTRKGTPEEARNYCMKKGPKYEKVPTNVFFEEHGVLPQEKRKGVKRKRQYPDDNYFAKLKEVQEKYTPFRETDEKYPFQQEILDIIATPPDPYGRTVHWYWSEGGHLGKTTLLKHIIATYPRCAIVVNGKAQDVRMGILNHYKTYGIYPGIIVTNIPKSTKQEYLSYESIENCIDMFFFSGKYEGGTICGPAPHLIVMSNHPPEKQRMSRDRWKITCVPTPEEYYKEEAKDLLAQMHN